MLIVLIDDAGFGTPDTFGGAVSTPNMTRVQRMGLTYNRFHVTAVCSPTRAALLTGRNHHRVGMGTIAPYAFTGTVKQVIFDLKPATHDQEKALHEHHSRETVAAGVAG